MMRDDEIAAILAERGYKRVESPDGLFRTWLWVAPDREGPVLATKLCMWEFNLSPAGLHFLLDHDCELKSAYYTDADRARNAARMGTRKEGE